MPAGSDPAGPAPAFVPARGPVPTPASAPAPAAAGTGAQDVAVARQAIVEKAEQLVNAWLRTAKRSPVPVSGRSPLLERRPSPGKGRGIFALEHIKAGDTVLISEPLTIAVFPELRLTVCNSCGARFSERMPAMICSSCRAVAYCSQELARFVLPATSRCQAWDWTNGHKMHCRHGGPPQQLECDLLTRLWFSSAMNDTLRTAAWSLLTDHYRNFDAQLSEEAWQARLAPAIQRLTSPRVGRTRWAEPSADGQGVAPSLRSLKRMLARSACNDFDVFDEQLQPWAHGTYPIGALLNHSCEPNCVVTFIKRTQMIRALRDIASGEELTIAYVDVAHPLQQRQELLRSQYHFTCDCPYCVAEARYVPGLLMGRLSPQATKAAIIHAITTIFQYFVVDPEAAVADRFVKAPRLEWVEDLLQRWQHGLTVAERLGYAPLPIPGSDVQDDVASAWVDELKQSPDPLLNRNLIPVMQLALDRAVADSRWAEACVPAMWLVLCYRACYGYTNPLVGLQFFSLGKLYWNSAYDRHLARIALLHARRILTITHGRWSEVVKAIDENEALMDGTSARDKTA